MRTKPACAMVEGNMLFEELIVEAKFDDGEEPTSKQAVAMVFEDLKMNNLQMYFIRLD